MRNKGLHLLIRAVMAGTLALVQTEACAAKPVDPVTAIVDAFRRHDVVALADAHGNVQSKNFKGPDRDPRFAAVGQRHRRGVRQRPVSGRGRSESCAVRPLTSDHSARCGRTPQWPRRSRSVRGFRGTVRVVNARLPPDKPSAGPSFGSADRLGRGQDQAGPFHVARRCATRIPRRSCKSRCWRSAAARCWSTASCISSAATSCRTSKWIDWRMQTIVSLIEHGIGPGRVFTIWQFDDDGLAKAQADVASWPAPSIAVVRGTRIGAADVTGLMPSRAQHVIRVGQARPGFPRRTGDRFASKTRWMQSSILGRAAR